MKSEKVKEIKELLRCLNGEKPCTDCYINEVAREQETCCINVVADMTLELINELESENERLGNKNYQLEQNLGQCENGYKLELHTARYQLRGVNEDLKKAQDRIAELEKENEKLKNRITCQIVIPNDKLEEIKKECLKKVEVDKDQLLKEFAERLKEISCEMYLKEQLHRCIDETLKEFIGE